MSEEKKMTGYPSIDKPWEKGKTYFQKHPIIPHTNICSLIKLVNLGNMDSPAVTCHSRTYTYRQMLRDAAVLSGALLKNGVKRGDIIAVCLPNYYEAVLVFLACNRIGAVFTCLNLNASIGEIEKYIELYNTPILFTSRTDLVRPLFENTDIRQIVMIGKKASSAVSDCITSFSAFIRQGKAMRTGGLVFNIKDDAMILYTSGTTGKPKSVVLTNENVIASIIYEKNTATDKEINVSKTLTCVPFSYPYGLITSLITSLLWKKEVILAPFIGMTTIRYYLSFKPNMIMGSPALLNLIINGIPKDFDLSFITYFISGGDFLPKNQAQKGKVFFMKHGCTVEIGNGFGNAETVSNGTTPVGVEIKPDTVGKILSGTDVMIVDPTTFEEKRYGEEGLMLAAGKHVFKEYFNELELTAEAKKTINGREYFITGTMGYIDEDGYFTLTGRQSRFYINASLNKIYLDHIQKAIENLDCVDSCAVIKVPDNKELFVNKAYIVLKHGFEPTREMKEHILKKLSIGAADEEACTLKSHELPTYIEFIEAIPLMSGSEKVDYRSLEKMAEEPIDNA